MLQALCFWVCYVYHLTESILTFVIRWSGYGLSFNFSRFWMSSHFGPDRIFLDILCFSYARTA